MAEQRLQGKIAVVSGGGSGIGKATAIRFAEQGAKVVMLDRTPKHAEETKATIEQAGGEALVLECDISKPDMIQQGFAKVVETYGKLDIVFANAGINGTMAPIETLELEEWDRTMNINLRGTFATVKYAVPYLKERGGTPSTVIEPFRVLDSQPTPPPRQLRLLL